MFDDLPPFRCLRESVRRRAAVREYGYTVWALNWMEGVQEGSPVPSFFLQRGECNLLRRRILDATLSLSLGFPIARLARQPFWTQH